MKKPALLLPAFFMILLLSNYPSTGQILITSGSAVTPEQMVENIVGEGIQYSNVQYTGADTARGIFTNGSSTNLGMESGILLTTGNASFFQGPNYSSNCSWDNNLFPQMPPGWDCYDYSVLRFDFIPDSDTVKIRYVFSSEDYNEWVGSSFVDIMKIYINGPKPEGGYYGHQNIAIVPGTNNTAVGINTINNGYALPGEPPQGPGVNSWLYNDNTNGLTLEYDGMTYILTAWVAVVPCQDYFMEIGTCDRGDHLYDSGIAIEEGSLQSPVEIEVSIILDPQGLTQDLVEGHVEADLVFKLPSAEYAPVTICFEIDGTAMNGLDYEFINNCITFEEGEDSALIHVTALQDGMIEGDETIMLIIENALGCSITYDTVVVTILDYLEMFSQITPTTAVCIGQEVELWVNVYNGFPPYTYNWQPGSYTNDTILVSPEETTTYIVTYQDIFLEDTGSNSTTVNIAPDFLNEIYSYSFEKESNPDLPWDVIGELSGDSVFVILPEGALTGSLIASFTISNCAVAYVNGVEQVSGITANNFTNPLNYNIIAQNGDIKEWVVVAMIETGIKEDPMDIISIYPNPSMGSFYLGNLNLFGYNAGISITDVTGRVVYQTERDIMDIVEIDMTDKPKGIYFLRVKLGEMEINRKVIIQ